MDKHNDRDRVWALSALEQELTTVNGLPVDTNIKKPNNELWGSLFRIAGLVNGSHLEAFSVLNSIKFASRHISYTPKDIDYQWERALNRAKPRGRRI